MKVALVGCGKHMNEIIIPTLKALPDIEMVACIDTNAHAALQTKHVCNAKYAFIGIKDMFDHNFYDFHAAILALPASSAFSVASALLELRKPLFIEKPPAESTKDIQDLAEEARRYGTPVQVGFNYRFADAFETLQAHINAQHSLPYISDFEFRSKYPAAGEWNRSDPIEAWVYHNGIHVFDLVSYIIGAVKKVKVDLVSFEQERFSMSVTLSHSNGSTTHLVLGNNTSAFEFNTTILDGKGRKYKAFDMKEVSFAESKLHTSTLFTIQAGAQHPNRAGYLREFDAFCNRNKADIHVAIPTLADAITASEIADMIVESVRRESTITLEAYRDECYAQK